MEINAGDIYRHFKGGIYMIVCLAVDEERRGHYRVIYRDISKSVIYDRRYEVFTSMVDPVKYPDYAGQHRFVKI